MAGTRLLIIQSFLIPFLLYAVIVCFGFGFFLHSDHRNSLAATTTEIAPLLWKRLTDAAWIYVALPILIHIPSTNQTTEMMRSEIKWTNDAITALRTFPTRDPVRDRNESCDAHSSERTRVAKGTKHSQKVTSMTLLFDQAVSNWKEYLLHTQIWIDRTNNQLQNVLLLSTLCPNMFPIELMDLYHTDDLRNIAVSDHRSDLNHSYRYLSTTDHGLMTLLSSDEYKSEHVQHILLYVPSEATYFVTPNMLLNDTASIEDIVQLSVGTEPTIAAESRASCFFGIVNPNENDNITTVLTTLLDQIYHQYFWNCLLDVDVVPNTLSDNATAESYLMLYYHRTFSKWYESLIDRLESTWLEMLSLHQEHSMYVHEAWSSTSLLIPAQNKLRILVTDFLEWKASTTDSDGLPSWLYRTNYQDTYERLKQIEESLVQLANDVNNMRLTVKQSGTMIVDLDVVIHDLPIEQHLAIFGPLLFPLVVPLLITLVREYARLRKRQRVQR